MDHGARYCGARRWEHSADPRHGVEQVGYDLIGRMILKRRVRLLMSQRTLATRAGLQQSTISRLENGKQYGLRWSRFAILVAVLGGLDEETAVLPVDSMWATDLPPRRRNWL